MDRPEHFRQSNPRDQFTVVLMGLEGHLDNIQSGITPAEKTEEKTAQALADLRKFLPYLAKKW